MGDYDGFIIFFQFLTGFFVVLLILLIMYLIGLWKIFKKAERNGWEAIVPFYNTWVLSEITGIAWWYPLIIIISNLAIVEDGIISVIIALAAFVANFFIFYNLSMKFHRGVGFAVLMTIFPYVMIPIMGFSKNYQYDKNVTVSNNGPFGNSNINSFSFGANSYDFGSKRYCQYCGREINGNVKYCGNCGNEIK